MTDFMDRLAAKLGWRHTRTEARGLGVCVRCGYAQTVAWTAEDMAEWRISLLCPGCFTEITKDVDCD